MIAWNDMSNRSACLWLTNVAMVFVLLNSAAASEIKKVWRDLGFGMTLDEAVTGLGELVQRIPTAAEQEAERRRKAAPIEVSAVSELGSECIRREKEAGRPTPPSVTDAHKVLSTATKSRTWVSRGWHSDDGQRGPARLSGVLQQIDAQGNMTIQLGNRRLVVSQVHELDASSRTFVESVRSAASVIDEFRQAVADREFTPDDSMRIKSVRELRIKTVDIEGLKFQPELRFTPNLSSIILRTDGAKAGPNVFEMLTESLRRTYGKEDEAIKSDDGRRRVWKQENAVIVLSQIVTTSYVPVYSAAAGPATGNTALSAATNNVVSIEYISPDLKTAGDRLTKGQAITAGDGLRSQSGQYVLLFRADGNLVLHHNGQPSPEWSSQTIGTNAVSLKFGDDGDLALYDADGKRVWSTGTGGRGGEYVWMQDDGNLVIYANERRAIWATGTERH